MCFRRAYPAQIWALVTLLAWAGGMTLYEAAGTKNRENRASVKQSEFLIIFAVLTAVLKIIRLGRGVSDLPVPSMAAPSSRAYLHG
jgi:hypothetical protein